MVFLCHKVDIRCLKIVVITIKLLTILDGVEGGGRHQRSIFDTQCQMTWQQWQMSGEASSTLNVESGRCQGKCPQHSTLSDMAEQRA